MEYYLFYFLSFSLSVMPNAKNSVTPCSNIDCVALRKGLTIENRNLRQQLMRCKKVAEKKWRTKMQTLLGRVFSAGQVKLLLNPQQKKTRWSAEDIAEAISLRSVSLKGYRYWREKKNLPLPALSTLRKWVATFDVNEGVLHDVLKVMRRKGQNMTDMQKITVICFNEIHLANRVAIERKEERVIGPNKKCQIFIARGLFSKWKQPIYYQFDQKVTTDILFDILRKLYSNGYRVVGITSDLGPDNQGLLKCLNIDPISEGGKTFFLHPSDANLRVHVFADPPHLIKLL